MAQSILAYYGGKFRMLGKHLPLFPDHKIYVGGGSVILNKPKSWTEVNALQASYLAIEYSQRLIVCLPFTPKAVEGIEPSSTGM